MILFTILLFILAILTTITIFAISIGGAGVVLVFGDVIACVAFIVLLMRFIIKRRRG